MIRKDQLDIPINELHPEALNTQTTREFIRESEQEFEMAPRNLDELSEKELKSYIEFLDDLWNK